MSLSTVSLTPGKRVLFLTKDPALIRRQLARQASFTMDDLAVEDLLDDVNTDVMTPAWTCFDFEPERIAENAYAGLVVDGERVIPEGALRALCFGAHYAPYASPGNRCPAQ